MAYSDKDIVIIPNKGSTTQKPTIRLTDGLAASSSTVSLGVETVNGVAAFTVDGTQGRLLTIVDSFTGTIFAITDNVGVPILAADNTGTVTIGQFKGTLDVRSTATISRLVTGNISTSTSDLVLSVSSATSTIRFVTSSTTRYQIGPLGQWGIGGANYGSTGSVFSSNGPNLAPSWTTDIGTASSTLTLLSTIAFNRSFNEIVASPTISAGTLTLDLSTAGIFNVTLNATVTTFNVTNPVSSGRASSFILILNYQATAYSVTWPVSFRWADGTPPTLTNTDTKRDIFTIFTTDGGTSYNAFVSGKNL